MQTSRKWKVRQSEWKVVKNIGNGTKNKREKSEERRRVWHIPTVKRCVQVDMKPFSVLYSERRVEGRSTVENIPKTGGLSVQCTLDGSTNNNKKRSECDAGN
jgi:hypothetical protein